MIGKSITVNRSGFFMAVRSTMFHLGMRTAVESQLEICEKIGIGVAAVLMEPIQGEAGAIVPPDDFWPRIREATKHYGTLLHRRRSADRSGPYGKTVGCGSLECCPRYSGGCQISGRRGHADQRVLLDRRDLAVHDVPKSVHPYHHHGWRCAGLFCSHCGDQRDLARRLWEAAAAKGDYLIPKLKELALEISANLSRRLPEEAC